MIRILVCGSVDDPKFIQDKLDEMDRTYGPVSCVVHTNHPEALRWQQRVSRARRVLHMPINENPRIHDKKARWDECRDRMFAQGRPDYVVIFQSIGRRERSERISAIATWAENRCVPVLTFAPDEEPKRAARPTRLQVVASS